MKKLTRRDVLAGSTLAGLSTIASGLYVRSLQAATQHSTGWVDAGDAQEIHGSGDLSWKSADLPNITTIGSYIALDGAHSQLGSHDTTNVLWCRKYNLQIPVTATIDGVETMYFAGGVGSATKYVQEESIQLTKHTQISGSRTGINGQDVPHWVSSQTSSGCLSTATGAIYNGGSGTLWFSSLTPADVNHDDFGVRIKAENAATGKRCAWFDVMRVKVHYTLP